MVCYYTQRAQWGVVGYFESDPAADPLRSPPTGLILEACQSALADPSDRPTLTSGHGRWWMSPPLELRCQSRQPHQIRHQSKSQR
jgi:hypothetical protein